ncbi:hypothetical protein EI94DRAFT_1805141 [Lactarius quietus]|nr:hypothetical protein EI94DRAFT_1805141 [Lactarius quietus]
MGPNSYFSVAGAAIVDSLSEIGQRILAVQLMFPEFQTLPLHFGARDIQIFISLEPEETVTLLQSGLGYGSLFKFATISPLGMDEIL